MEIEPLDNESRGKACTLCKCEATALVFGFRVCAYHVDHGEDDAPCPKCPRGGGS